MPPPPITFRRLIEYSEFFSGEKPIDIRATLCLFSRGMLVRMAALLSLHYGNLEFPDEERTLFSEESKRHIPYLTSLFDRFYRKNNLKRGEKVQISTYRTALELWRNIFAVRPEEYTNTVRKEDVELLLFKVILTLNEKISSFTKRKDDYKMDELLFLNQFISNDGNNYDLQSALQPQIYYFCQFVAFAKTNPVLAAASEKLFARWGITSWRQYYATIIWLANATDKYYRVHQKGVPSIPLDKMGLNDETGLFSKSLVEHLSIDEDAFIPCEDGASQESNIDYKVFRSKPFVRLKDVSRYAVINNQFLCERLFNSLYFDLIPLINGRESSCGRFDFNKEFIEKILFRHAFFKCLSSDAYTFPPSKDYDEPEVRNEPDSYVRYGNGSLVITECKAIKINGECRDDGDYSRLLDELREKVVLKTRNLDKSRKKFSGEPEPIGIGQLIGHIEAIRNGDFQWDVAISTDAACYPLLVLEDVKLLSCGMLSILNRWFYEELRKRPGMRLAKMTVKPVMAVSINTLYLYDDYISEHGLTNIIDEFLRENARFDAATGEYELDHLADFDGYLRRNRFDKSGEVEKLLMNI